MRERQQLDGALSGFTRLLRELDDNIELVSLGEELHYKGKPPFSWTDKDDLLALVDDAAAVAGEQAAGAHRVQVPPRIHPVAARHHTIMSARDSVHLAVVALHEEHSERTRAEKAAEAARP